MRENLHGNKVSTATVPPGRQLLEDLYLEHKLDVYCGTLDSLNILGGNINEYK